MVFAGYAPLTFCKFLVETIFYAKIYDFLRVRIGPFLNGCSKELLVRTRKQRNIGRYLDSFL